MERLRVAVVGAGWIAADHVGAPVAVIVPRTGEAVEGWAAYERYVSARLGGRTLLVCLCIDILFRAGAGCL